MKRTRTSFAVLSHAALCVALVAPLGACKDDKKDEGTAATKSDKEATGDKPGEKTDGEEDTTKEGGLAEKLAGGLVEDIAPADKITRGDALAHFLIASPTKLLDEVRTQAAPSRAAATLNEAALKALGGMALGDKSAVLQHVDFSKPAGCVVINSTALDVPVACTVGYQGGGAALATDLGSTGKQADAAGHIAHYVMEGQNIFIDDLEGQIVVSNHAELFGKSKDYIATNMLARAGKLASDVEIVAFLEAASKRYESQINTVMAEMEKASSIKTGEKFVDSMMEYNRKSTKDSLDRLKEIEQITVGFGLEPVGFVARYATFPVEGSRLQKDAEAAAAGPMQRSTVESLPANSFVAFGMNADWKKAWDTESFAEMRGFVIEAYADAVGHDPTAVKTALDTYMAETRDIYGNEFAFGLAHEPGTVGGFVMSQSMTKPGRDNYIKYAKLATPEVVMGKLGTEYVTWKLEEKVSEVDGAPVDRLTIEPGPKLAEKIKAEVAKDPKLAAIETKVGGFKIVMDRAETGDRAFYVLAPKAEDQYMKSLMAAAKGDKSLAGDKGIALVFDRNPKVSAVMAVNGKGAIAWLKEIIPPEKAAEIPPDLGNDMSDFFFVSSYGAKGSQTGEIVLGQPVIDQIRKLAE